MTIQASSISPSINPPPTVDAETESVQLPNGDWVVANATRLWLHQAPMAGLAPLTEALTEPSEPDRTRQLLAGVLTSALRQGSREQAAPRSERETSWRHHLWSLASSYQTTHATPATMRRVAGRFETEGRPQLADYCRHVADEESGHDELALRDLRAMGLQAEALVAAVQPPNALALVALFRRLADGPEPIAVLGYAYVLERMALFSTAEYVQAIEAALPPGVKATRCLRVHSAVGTDQRHVRESLEFIANLPAQDRRAIFQAAFESALLMAMPSDYPGDEAIDALVTRFRVASSD